MRLEPRVVTKPEPITHQVRKFHSFVHAVPSAWNILPLPIGRTVWGGEPDWLGSNPSSTTCFSSETMQMTCDSDVHLSNGAAGGPYLTQGSKDSVSRCVHGVWNNSGTRYKCCLAGPACHLDLTCPLLLDALPGLSGPCTFSSEQLPHCVVIIPRTLPPAKPQFPEEGSSGPSRRAC